MWEGVYLRSCFLLRDRSGLRCLLRIRDRTPKVVVLLKWIGLGAAYELFLDDRVGVSLLVDV